MNLNGQLCTCYSVQKRRGMNRRLAYQHGNFKNLRSKSPVDQSKKAGTWKDEQLQARDSEEELPIDEVKASDDESSRLDSEHSPDKGSIARSEHLLNANDSFNQEQSLDDGSDDETVFSKRNFSDMQDDRQIVKIAAINDKYKLVERPRFLVSFDTMTWESKFATSVFRKHFKTEICTFIAKGILDLLLAEAVVFSVHGEVSIGIYFIVAVCFIVYFSLATAFLFCRKRRKPRCVLL